MIHTHLLSLSLSLSLSPLGDVTSGPAPLSLNKFFQPSQDSGRVPLRVQVQAASVELPGNRPGASSSTRFLFREPTSAR